MSLYNMMNGINKTCVLFILPMLGRHPDKYPRFRDCFLSDEEHPEYDNHIHIYTRVGGGNRGCGYGEEDIMKHSDFVTTYDDSYDSTYGSYIFSIPKEFKADFDKIIAGDLKNISVEYKNKVREVFPKLKEQLDGIWETKKPLD